VFARNLNGIRDVTEHHGRDQLLLTRLGGGALGNETGWIIEGIQRALTLYQDAGLDVAIVSYGSSKAIVQKLVKRRAG